MFSPFGVPTDNYNAIGFNRLDGFIYAVRTQPPATAGHILRIDDAGTVTDTTATVGASQNVGAFDDAGNYHVTATSSGTIYTIDVTTPVPTVPPPDRLRRRADLRPRAAGRRPLGLRPHR